MPEKETFERARKDKEEGKAPSTQAGEFIREEVHHIREGKHGARSTKQAIAIGLSKARRAGGRLQPPRKGTVSEKTRRSAELALRKGQRRTRVSEKRSRASRRARYTAMRAFRCESRRTPRSCSISTRATATSGRATWAGWWVPIPLSPPC